MKMSDYRNILYPIQFDGYLVICKEYDSNFLFMYNNWVDENCVGRVASSNHGYDRLFVFENEDEAIAFKLRWM